MLTIFYLYNCIYSSVSSFHSFSVVPSPCFLFPPSSSSTLVSLWTRGNVKKAQLKVTRRLNNSPARELIFKRLESLNISARDSLYSQQRSETRRERTRGRPGPKKKERKKPGRNRWEEKKCRTGADRENEGRGRQRKREEEGTRRTREEEVVRKRWERRRNARIFLRTVTLSGRTRGRLILLHVMQISRERCSPAFRAAILHSPIPTPRARQVRKETIIRLLIRYNRWSDIH